MIRPARLLLVHFAACLSGLAVAQQLSLIIPPRGVPRTPKEVVSAYVTAELASGDLAAFCRGTRPYVIKANDYPECPPHPWALIVDEKATSLYCEPSAGGTRCIVNYRVLAEGVPQHAWDDLIRATQKTAQVVYEVSPDGKIVTPYVVPHVGLKAVRDYLAAERRGMASKEEGANYVDRILRAEQVLAGVQSR